MVLPQLSRFFGSCRQRVTMLVMQASENLHRTCYGQMQRPKASPLLCLALRRWVGRQGDPGVPAFLPDRDGRRWEIGIGEGADGNRNHVRKACVFPIER